MWNKSKKTSVKNVRTIRNRLAMWAGIAWLSSMSVVPAFAQFSLADPGYIHNKKANQMFDAKDYDNALKEYIQALSYRDNSPEIKYNMANGFVETGRAKDAIKVYEDLLKSAPKELRPKLYYNTGNALYKSNQFKEAASYYKKALMADPGDRWAKENYELALRKIQEQQQKKKQDQKDDKDKKQDKNKNQQQNKPDKEQQKNQQQKQQSKAEKDKKQAERMLKALREQEKQDRKKNAKRKQVHPVERNVKDW